MRNKKGFTLIELLAVIVILAIIALIVTPIVLDTIDKADKNAFKNSAYGLISSGELYHSSRELELEQISGELVFKKIAGSESLQTSDGEKLKTNGSAPDGTILKINEKGEIAFAMHNGKYCITKSYLSKDFKLTEETQDNCTVPALSFSDLVDVEKTEESTGGSSVNDCLKKGEKCDLGTPIEIKVNTKETYKFYVIKDDRTTVNLIMATDLGDPVAWNDNGETTQGPLTALALLKERTKDWVYLQEYSYTLQDGYSSDGRYEDLYVEKVRARLPKHAEIAGQNGVGCSPNISLKQCPSWLVDGLSRANPKGFWLSDTASGAKEAYAVYCEGNLTKAKASDGEHGVLRPVISISK